MSESEPDSIEQIRAFRFGEFELRPGSHELLRNGQAVVLQPKVFDFIAYLLINRSRLIDKNELLEAVWPHQVVTDAALSRCVMKARRALDEDAENPKAIQTVHGRGFRFVALVDVVVIDKAVDSAIADLTATDSNASSEPAASVAAHASKELGPIPQGISGLANTARTRTWTRSVWIASGLIAIVLLVWLVQRPESQGRSATAQMRVAVLPVENHTGDPRQDWARLGLMTAIDEILRVEGPVRVMGAREVVDLDGEEEKPETLDRQLREIYGITHIVRGKIQQNAGQLRFDYRVRDAENNDRRRSVVAADITSLAHAAGADLRIALGLSGDRAEVTSDSFANEAYLRGRALRLQGDVPGSQKYYALAVEQAPGEFWPRYEVAIGLRDLGEREKAHAQLRLLLDEADANGSARQRSSVRNALAIMSWRNGDLDGAAALLDEAYTMSRQLDDPDRSAAILINLGILAKNRDQLGAARDYLNQAAEFELIAGKEMPSGNVLHTLGQVELKLGDLDSAGNHFQSAIDRFELVGERRSAAVAMNSLAHLRWRQARAQDTRTLYTRALQQHRELGNRSSEVTALIGLGLVEMDQGQLAKAGELAELALRIAHELGEAPKVMQAFSLLGLVQGARLNFTAARASQAKALEEAHSINEIDGILHERLLIATIDWRLDKNAEAGQAALAILEEARAGRFVLLEVDALLLISRMRMAAQEWNQARESLEAAQARIRAVGDPRRNATVYLALAEASIGIGDLAEAEVQIQFAELVLGATFEVLKLRATLAAGQGDAGTALDYELAARIAAAERWTLIDEERLLARREAVP
ncbi:tetratricopeptide repeat protein [Dokdonella sp.]|uniref:tetratricopeptide repeat protein n=1 Tax=Dokdonella sp. TaxID=2291710 RepID=UPI003C5F4913